MFSSNLKIEVSENEAYNLVKFYGSLDSYALQEKKEEILAVMDNFNKRYLVFDFAQLEYLNSESISFLMQISSHLVENEQALVIIDARKNVLDVLKVIGFFEANIYYKNLSDFIKGKINVD